MKKLISLSAAILSALLLSAQPDWQLIQLNIPEELNCVKGTPNGMICIGGELGDIYRTDTSLSLNSTLPGNMEGISDIIFRQNGDGWSVGEDGLILKSTDNGLSWSSVPSGTSSSLESITFINQDTAFIAGRNGTILRSVDGGITWSALVSGTTERLEGIAFTNALHGFVAGREGVFLETTNGGNTWTSNSLGTDDNKEVVFVDQNIGFVAGGNGLFRSTDGGNTWSVVVTSNEAEFEALAFMNMAGLAVGEDGLIYASSDGGLSWAKDTSFNAMLGIEFSDVAFVDTLGAIAVGEVGYIAHRFKTSQGGGSVSMREVTKPQLNFYPNPADDLLTLEIPDRIKVDKVMLINPLGAVVEHPLSDQHQLDLSSVPNGVYFLKIVSDGTAIPGEQTVLVSH